MHYIRLFLLTCLLLLIVVTGRVNSQWIQIDGPVEAEVNHLAISPDGTNLLATISAGYSLYFSSNGGLSWKNLQFEGGNSRAIIFIDNNNFLTGTSGNGIFLSTNKGQSWTEINSGLTNKTVNAFAIIGNNIFAGTWGGVFLSTNNGNLWKEVNSGLPKDKSVQVFHVNGTRLFAAIDNIIYLSTDYGSSWKAVTSKLTGELSYIECFVVKGNNIFAGNESSSSGLFQSAINGNIWTVNSGLKSGVSDLAILGNDILAAGGTVYISTDAGASWIKQNSGLPPNYGCYTFAVHDNSVYVGTRINGVYFSPNKGKRWVPVNVGFPSPISCLVSSGKDLIAGTGYLGAFHAENNGMIWYPIGLNGKTVWSAAISPNEEGGTNIFAGTLGGGLYLSTNYGKSWTRSGIGGSIYALSASRNKIFASTHYDYGQYSKFIYFSSDYGKNWTKAGLDGKDVLALAISGNNVFAGAREGLFLTTDNGGSWTDISNDLPNKHVQSIALTDNNIFVGIYGGGVFCSTNNGQNWTEVNSGLSDKYIQSFTVFRNIVFLGNSDGVFFTTNSGSSWKNIGLSNVGAITNNGHFIFASVYKYPEGLWARSLLDIIPLRKELSETELSGEIPTEFSLEQNYPNPFNPTTTIKFSLPEASHVSLKVYNSLGREVAEIISKDMDAGIHSFEWNASGLPSGIYYYRIITTSYNETKKLLLLK